MGSVKIDIHKNEYKWHVVNFSEEKAIKGLLKFRSEFDTSLNINQDKSITKIVETAGINDFDKEAICLYVSLDNLIDKCNFNHKQRRILNFYQDGCTEEDIAKLFNDTQQNIYGIINTCIKKIAIKNKENWLLDFFYWDKSKTKEKWKQCTNCRVWKPESSFYYDNANQSFKSKCKEC